MSLIRLRAGRLLLPAGFVVAAAVLAGSAPAEAATKACPTSNPPNTLVVAGGSPQTAKLRSAFQTNFQVALANTNSCPLTGSLGGVGITFVAPAGGASGSFASSGSNAAIVGTNTQGVATAPDFTANEVAGTYGIYAESDYGTVRLDVSNTAAGVVASIVAASSTAQEATVDSPYAQPLQAQILDPNGHPVQGATVSFSIVPGAYGAAASFLSGGTQASAKTDSNGLATSPPLAANGSPGRFTATASTDGVSGVATYSLDNHAATNTLTAADDPAQATTIDTRYPRPLTARFLDPTGQPLEGATVTFAIQTASSGATASFPDGSSQTTATTDSQGIASSPALTANRTAGSFTATATLTGSRPLRYRLRNRAAAPAAVAAGAANGQSLPIGTRLPLRLAVTVTDAHGNPVAGATVTFTAPSAGPGGRFTIYTRKPKHRRHGKPKPPVAYHRRVVHAATNSKGVAIAPPFAADEQTGGYVVTARAGNARAAFALVNTAP